jgi:hypothetical protein
MFAHVLGRTLGRKYVSCFRKKDIGKEMFTHVSGRRILGRKCLHMFQEEGYWEGNVCTCLRKDIGKEICVMLQEEGYCEGNVYTCLRKKNIGKETLTHVSGRKILGRKCLHMSQEDGY